jgi:DNA-binding NtrC family response regulator
MAQRTGTTPVPARATSRTQAGPDENHSTGDGDGPGGGLRAELRRREVEIILEALRAAAWNQTEAARRLGLPRRTLVYKLRALGIGKAYGARDDNGVGKPP